MQTKKTIAAIIMALATLSTVSQVKAASLATAVGARVYPAFCHDGTSNAHYQHVAPGGNPKGSGLQVFVEQQNVYDAGFSLFRTNLHNSLPLRPQDKLPIPSGQVTFRVHGLPDGGGFFIFIVSDTGCQIVANQRLVPDSHGVVTIVVPTIQACQGQFVSNISVNLDTGPNPSADVILSNFSYNNTLIPVDLTLVDDFNQFPGNFCYPGPAVNCCK